jgi:hypothetical protein
VRVEAGSYRGRVVESIIAFATLWLGVVAGRCPVEVLVAPEVRSVELLLDGAAVAALQGPPWSTAIDLGERPAPHELVAVARGAGGEELGRARQLLNVPRQPAEVGVTLETTPTGRVARLAWQAVGGAAPLAVRVSVDGVEVPVVDPRRVALPAVDEAGVHLLAVEVDFPGALTASAEIAFGGQFFEQAASALTSVPIVLAGKRSEVDEVVLIDAGGAARKLVTVEKGLADIVVVLDPGARAGLAATSERVNRRQASPPGPPQPTIRNPAAFRAALRPDQRLRIVWPAALAAGMQDEAWRLFPTSEYLSPRDGGLLWQLAHVGAPATGEAPRLADAVITAGLRAAERSQRRAVVLLLGPEPRDASTYSPAAARHYLESLRVPLVVWSAAPVSPALAAAWGEPALVGDVAKLERQVRALGELLDAQRIAWVEGHHLPHRLTLAPGTQGIALAGTAAPVER